MVPRSTKGSEASMVSAKDNDGGCVPSMHARLKRTITVCRPRLFDFFTRFLVLHFLAGTAASVSRASNHAAAVARCILSERQVLPARQAP